MLWWSLCNLVGIATELLLRCSSNFRAIGKVLTWISRFRGFTRSLGKACILLMNRGPISYQTSLIYPFSNDVDGALQRMFLTSLQSVQINTKLCVINSETRVYTNVFGCTQEKACASLASPVNTNTFLMSYLQENAICSIFDLFKLRWRMQFKFYSTDTFWLCRSYPITRLARS